MSPARDSHHAPVGQQDEGGRSDEVGVGVAPAQKADHRGLEGEGLGADVVVHQGVGACGTAGAQLGGRDRCTGWVGSRTSQAAVSCSKKISREKVVRERQEGNARHSESGC